MAKSLLDKIAEILVGPARPPGSPEYGDVIVPWQKRLWRSIRPPDRVPRDKRPISSKQRRMILSILAAVVVIGGGWSAFSYFSSVKDRSMELYQEGMHLLGPNNLEGALAKFDAAIEVWPDNARAYLERGNVNRILGDNSGAIHDWSHAIELDGQLSDAYTARATMYRLDGDMPRALADLNSAIQIAPTMDAYFQRGQVFHAQGQYQQALEDYDRSIDQQPQAPYVYRARALTRSQLGDDAGSREDLAIADRLNHIR